MAAPSTATPMPSSDLARLFYFLLREGVPLPVLETALQDMKASRNLPDDKVMLGTIGRATAHQMAVYLESSPECATDIT